MKSLFEKLFSFNTLSVKTVMVCMLLVVSSFSMMNLNADTRYRVKSSDSLKRIVSREYAGSALSQQQLMIAIFIRNPKAFRKGDINLLMRGRRLVLPSEEKLEIVSHEDAVAILKRGTKSFQREILGEAEPITDFELSDLSHRDLTILSGEQPAEEDIEEQPEKQATGQTSTFVASQTSSRKKSRDKNWQKTIREKKALIKSRKELSLAKKKLKKMVEERKRLKAQLKQLEHEKKQADHKLLTLEETLQQRNEQAQIQKAIQVANAEIKKQEGNTQKEKQQVTRSTGSDAVKTLPEDVIAEDKKKREFEEKVKERTESLKEANVALQQTLQQTRSELAENTRENMSMSRKLKGLKENPAAQMAGNDKPATVNQSVATEIGSAAHSGKNLDGAVKTVSADSSLGKLLWLIPVLAFFAGLWFLLRRFLNTGKHDDTMLAEGEIYATPAFDSDDIDADYEEASLETSIKLDVARAYLEADDHESALEMLREVIDEGDEQQQQEARDIIAKNKLGGA